MVSQGARELRRGQPRGRLRRRDVAEVEAVLWANESRQDRTWVGVPNEPYGYAAQSGLVDEFHRTAAPSSAKR